jgi:hypothetical protein
MVYLRTLSPQTVEHRVIARMVRVSGYRSRGPGFDSRRFQIFWEAVGLERGPHRLVRTTEELLGRNRSGSGSRKPRLMTVGIRWADHATSSVRKSWPYFANKQRSFRSRKPRLTTGGIRCVDHATPSTRKSWHYFANNRRSLGRHSSLADQSHGVFL